jgi:hypothetical protein
LRFYSHGGEYKDGEFWDIAPCSLVVVDRRFRGAYCLHPPIFIALKALITTFRIIDVAVEKVIQDYDEKYIPQNKVFIFR